MPHYNNTNVPPRRSEEGKEKKKEKKRTWKQRGWTAHLHLRSPPPPRLKGCIVVSSAALTIGLVLVVQPRHEQHLFYNANWDGRELWEPIVPPGISFNVFMRWFRFGVFPSATGERAKTTLRVEEDNQLITICMDTTLRQIQCVVCICDLRFTGSN